MLLQLFLIILDRKTIKEDPQAVCNTALLFLFIDKRLFGAASLRQGARRGFEPPPAQLS
jgi:hypothetical protein